MSATESFIKDAISGGWLKSMGWSFRSILKSDMTVILDNTFHDGMEVSIYKVLLDPKSWVAVGKARGWSEHFGMFEFTGSSYVRHAPAYEKTLVNEELYKMHRFIDALAEGKSIEEALQALK